MLWAFNPIYVVCQTVGPQSRSWNAGLFDGAASLLLAMANRRTLLPNSIDTGVTHIQMIYYHFGELLTPFHLLQLMTISVSDATLGDRERRDTALSGLRQRPLGLDRW